MRVGDKLLVAAALRATFAKRPGITGSRRRSGPGKGAALAGTVCRASAARQGLRLRRAAVRRRFRHHRAGHRLRPYRAGPWRRRLGARHAPTASRCRRPWARTARSTPHVPLFAGKRVLTPDGKTGDADPAVIAALKEAGALLAQRHAHPQLSAFLALEGAADLPQHAAMVHLHGDERPAQEGAGRDRRHPLRPAAGPQPPLCHDREPAGLVRLAPARLGRADRGLRQQEDRRAAARPAVIDRIAAAFEKEGADAWYRQPARRASSATTTTPTTTSR